MWIVNPKIQGVATIIEEGVSMSVNELKENAAKYVYELRKFYPLGESPITHYICNNEVVVISTKKLYVFYYDEFIDYTFDVLSNVIFGDCGKQGTACDITIKDRLFHLVFQSKEELVQLRMYVDKWAEA